MSAKPGTERVDRDPALGELRRDRADEADDRVLRQRVHRGRAASPRARRARRWRRSPTPAPSPGAICRVPKTTPSTFAPTARRYSASPSSARSFDAGGDACVQEGELDGAHPLPCRRVGDVESGGEVERSDVAALGLEHRDRRRPDPRRAAGDERAHGTRTTLPTCRRSSISACAADASHERKLGADNRPDRALRPQADQLLGRLVDDRPARAASAGRDRSPATLTLRPTTSAGSTAGPHAARVADRDQRAQAASAPSATRRRPRRRPDRRRRRRGPIRRTPRTTYASSAPCSRTKARFSSEPAVATTRAPSQPAELDRRRPDAARARVDEHGRRPGRSRLAAHRDPGGQERHQEGRAFDERGAVRERHDPVGSRPSPRSRLPAAGPSRGARPARRRPRRRARPGARAAADSRPAGSARP